MDTLPNELVQRIFWYCDWVDILKGRCVSRKFNHLLNDESFIKSGRSSGPEAHVPNWLNDEDDTYFRMTLFFNKINTHVSTLFDLYDGPYEFYAPPRKSNNYTKRSIVAGQYLKGVPYGEWSLDCGFIKKIIRFNELGLKHGIQITTYSTHIVYSTMMNGIEHGPHIKKDKKGRIVAYGQFTNGKRSGIWMVYKLHINTEEVITEWMPTHLMGKGCYNNDERDGTWFFYDILKNTHMFGLFDNGKLIGDWTAINKITKEKITIPENEFVPEDEVYELNLI